MLGATYLGLYNVAKTDQDKHKKPLADQCSCCF